MPKNKKEEETTQTEEESDGYNPDDTIYTYASDTSTSTITEDKHQQSQRPSRTAARRNQHCPTSPRTKQTTSTPTNDKTKLEGKVSKLEAELKTIKATHKKTLHRLVDSEREASEWRNKYNKISQTYKETMDKLTKAQQKIEDMNPNRLHIIMDSNREKILPLLQTKLPKHTITQDTNIYKTSTLITHMQTYSPPTKDTVTIIMMGTNDLRHGNTKECYNNYITMKPSIPINTLLLHIPYQTPPSTHPLDIETHSQARRMINTKLDEMYETIPIPDTHNMTKLVTDGYHLSNEGATHIVEQIIKKIHKEQQQPILTAQPALLPTPKKTLLEASNINPHYSRPTPSNTLQHKVTTLDIDSKYTGLIIGTQGTNITNIEKQTGATIKTSTGDTTDTTTIRITSHSEENSQTAKQMILAMIDKVQVRTTKPTYEDTSTIRIERDTVPHVLGRGGRQRREIEESTQCHISTLELPNKDLEIKIQGTKQQVREARHRIINISYEHKRRQREERESRHTHKRPRDQYQRDHRPRHVRSRSPRR